jgi:transposase InsO family protein
VSQINTGQWISFTTRCSQGERSAVLHWWISAPGMPPLWRLVTRCQGNVSFVALRSLPSHGAYPVDNGPEFICKALQKWCEHTDVRLHFIQPGKPTQNAFIESLNGTFRHECLDAHSFLSMEDAKLQIEKWRKEYNTEKPHSSLEYRTPEEVEIDFFERMKEKVNLGTK